MRCYNSGDEKGLIMLLNEIKKEKENDIKKYERIKIKKA
jgi:hypothetical protein